MFYYKWWRSKLKIERVFKKRKTVSVKDTAFLTV